MNNNRQVVDLDIIGGCQLIYSPPNKVMKNKLNINQNSKFSVVTFTLYIPRPKYGEPKEKLLLGQKYKTYLLRWIENI